MRKLTKEDRARIIEMIHLNGNVPSDRIVNTLMNSLEFDPKAAKEQHARRYLGQLLRSARDENGTRTMFMDKNSGNVIDVGTCAQRSMLISVTTNLHANAKGNMKSMRKAAHRIAELDGQLSMFDGSVYELKIDSVRYA